MIPKNPALAWAIQATNPQRRSGTRAIVLTQCGTRLGKRSSAPKVPTNGQIGQNGAENCAGRHPLGAVRGARNLLRRSTLSFAIPLDRFTCRIESRGQNF